MSLINDALKKAQKLQARPTGATPAFPRPNTPADPNSAATGTSAATSLVPAAAPAPTTATLPPRTGKSPHSAFIVAIAATVLLAGIGAIGYVAYALFFMGTPAEQTVAVTPPETALANATSAPATPPPADAESSATTAANSAPTPTTVRAPAAPVASSTPAPASDPDSTSADTGASLVDVATTATASLQEEIEERVNNPKPHIQAWVDKITVSGIRPGDRPKALMNDRVYLIGDVVNRELGLQLFQVGERLLVFEDAEGNTYDYTF